MKDKIDNFIDFTRPEIQNKKEEKARIYGNVNKIPKGKQKVLNGFKSKIFPIKKPTHVTDLKILTIKQVLQRLLIALAQVKAGNTSERLRNEICQVIYSLYRGKEITKNVYNNKMNSIQI